MSSGVLGSAVKEREDGDEVLRGWRRRDDRQSSRIYLVGLC